MNDITAPRYEISVLVGPCSEDECESLMVAIAELPECKTVGGVVACHAAKDGDDA